MNDTTPNLMQIHPFVRQNLNPKFDLRNYQIQAILNLNDKLENQKSDLHFLFHMATGSGKTLVMAASILQLYLKGYQHFIFFVNSTSLIEKTKDNFLNSRSSKFLFQSKINFHGQNIEIEKVNSFQNSNKNQIQILFTTIQGLHSGLNQPKENELTFTDFFDKKLVLLSDEAHHINATTKKKLTQKEAENQESWEKTVNKIFHSHSENVLLEFSATVDFHHPEIRKKYTDKLLIEYDLSEFRKDKFSKNVQGIQSQSTAFERAVSALILSQWRKNLFTKMGKNVKPVVLFKSRTIQESEAFFLLFFNELEKLNFNDFSTIFDKIPNEIQIKISNFLKFENRSLENFFEELKFEFSPTKSLVVNSKNDSEEKQLWLNNLEDENNHFRLIFAVDKLNEGWDVLNLFDIVRLYDKNTIESNSKSARTTMSEAQLIGRGARYFPFELNEKSEKFKRKFDDDFDNNLRFLEVLFYHSSHNPNYIKALNSSLRKIGIIPEKNEQKSSSKIKKKGKISITSHEVLKKLQQHPIKINVDSDVKNLWKNADETEIAKVWHTIKINKIEPNIFCSALRKIPFYQFNHLKIYFPELTSINEFIKSNKYLNSIELHIATNNLWEEFSAVQKLNICILSLEKIVFELEKVKN